MYCRSCGQEIKDDAVICPHCGCTTGNKNVQPKSDDSSNAGWGVLGFFIPILGLILYLVWKQDYPLRAKSVGVGALISVVLSVVFVIIYIIIIAAALGCATSSYYY